MKMVRFMLANGSVEKQMAKAGCSIQMVMFTLGIGWMINKMVKEPICMMKPDLNTLEVGKTTRRMASERSTSQMEHSTQASISMECNTVKVIIVGQTDRHTKAIGKKIK